MTWNYGLGVKTSETDENGQVMRYEYDGAGRLVRIWSPYDTTMPAVAYGYDHGAFPWTATTTNKLLYDGSDTQAIRTLISVDGLGRALQTAKDGEYRDIEGNRHYGWNASGAVAYDAKGRGVSQGQPQFLESPGLPGLAPMSKPTTTTYDALDRAIIQTLPDGSTMRTDYLVEGTRLVERSTDPLGNMGEREMDNRGNVVAVRRLSAEGAVLMRASYSYDAMGQMLSAVDSKGNAVSLSYDLTGLRLSLSSADTGTILLSYDEAGNLVKKTDAVLRSHGESITYAYDGQGRLVKVTYPRTAATTYEYGDEHAAEGLKARLVSRSDSSGTTSYTYGRLGETLTMTRTIDRLTPLAPDASASFSYASDYLGRLQRITYPDGEVLTYGYDAGGQVKTVSGEHNGLTTTYVADIAYDPFGQRTYIEYGNGVRTSYAYDENRRWLDSIHTQNSRGNVYQDMTYSFDLVGNVSGYENRAGDYDTSQTYLYDGLYQLIGAKGTSEGRKYGLTEYTSSYSQSFTYDAIGNMTAKMSSVANSPSASLGDDLNYNLTYSYYSGKAHQVERIGNLYYRYDGNGNMIEERVGGHGTSTVLAGSVYTVGDVSMTDTGFGLDRSPTTGSTDSSTYARYFSWDEENRLVRSVDNNIAVQYSYGADGQRAVKYSKRGESLYFDSMWSCQTDVPSMRQLKNIFVGQTRIATRLSLQGESSTGYEKVNTYYYHPDHLGSAQLVTDYEGDIYERIEYTPYGETWIERTSDGLDLIPFRFTGKELDSETGLYYYGARYLNPKSSMWLSADPALGDYIPVAPVSDDARKHNQNLAGMGGVFNLINLAVYHYAANNPVKYTDPDGRFDGFPTASLLERIQWANGQGSDTTKLISRIRMGESGIPGSGPCLFMSYLGVAQTYAQKDLTPEQIGKLMSDPALWGADGAGPGNKVIKAALDMLGVDTSNLIIKVMDSPDGKADPSAFATVRRVGLTSDPNTAGHWQEGTNLGGFKWDAVDGAVDTGRKVFGLRNIYIIQGDGGGQ